MATLATLVVKLVGDVGGFSSAMDEAGRNVQQFGRNIGQVGQDLTTRVTAPIIGVGAAAVVMGNQFNAGMANVVSLVPEAAGEIANLRGPVQDLAVEMGQSTGSMTDGLYQVVSAFGYTSESMEILHINAMAGAAGLATTSEAIALTSAVTKGYGDTSAEAAQKAADLALKTVQLGQTTFPELAASIGRVTPLAASLGVAQEELFAVMATGTGVTGGAAEVSTQLRGVLQGLMAPTADMTNLMTDLGYANGTAMLEGLGLQGTIQAIVSAAEASGMPLQTYIGSIEGQTLALALAGPLSDAYTEKLGAMGSAAGSTQLAFDAQTQGLNASGFAMQQNAIDAQVLMQQLGTALGPVVLLVTGYVSQFVGWLTGLVDQFTALDPQTQMIILGVIGLVAAIGPLLMILGPLVTGFGAVVTVIGALVSPIGLVIAAVALLAVAVVQHFGGVQQTIQAASAFVQGIMQALSSFFSANQAEIGATIDAAWTRIRETVTTVVYWVQSVVSAVFGVVATFISNHGQEIAAFLSAAWTQIRTIIDLALQLIQAVVTTVFGAITAFISQHGAEIQAILTAAWNMIKSLVQIALDLIEGIIRVALAIIRGDWETAWTEVQTLVVNLWTSIQSYIEAALQFVIGLVTLFVNTVVQWFTNLYNQLVGGSIVPDMVTGIIRWFTQLGERAAELVQELVRSVVDGFTRLRTNVEEAVSQLKQRALDLITGLVNGILGLVGGLAGGLRDRGAGMVRAFADGVISALGSAIDAARRLAQELRDLLPGSDAKYGPLSDLTASGRSLPETLGAAISRGAPAAVDAAAGLAGGLAGVLGMDTADLGAQAGLGWIDAMIKAIESRLPALQAAVGQVWSELGGQGRSDALIGRAGASDRSEPSTRAGERGPVTINLNGPWNVSNDMDAQRIAEIVGDVLAGKAITNKRMNVGWATVATA
jgi:TP901 family phage tail tape measure protein